MNECPLHCGFSGPIEIHEAAGVTVFVCPECLGVGFDGGAVAENRSAPDLVRALAPVIERTIESNSVDALTGLGNRRFFLARLTAELRNARHRHFVSVTAFSIPKPDDESLKRAAGTLADFARANENFGRVEPNVFGLILPRADEKRAEEIAKRILSAANSRLRVRDQADLQETVMLSTLLKTRHVVVRADHGESAIEVWDRVLEKLVEGESDER